MGEAHIGHDQAKAQLVLDELERRRSLLDVARGGSQWQRAWAATATLLVAIVAAGAALDSSQGGSSSIVAVAAALSVVMYLLADLRQAHKRMDALLELLDDTLARPRP